MNGTLLRTTGTAVIAALAVLQGYYPHDTGITAALTAAGAIGIHVIPAITQVQTVRKAVNMTEATPEETGDVANNLGSRGAALMGLGTPEAAPEPVPFTLPPRDLAAPEQPPELVPGPPDTKAALLTALENLASIIREM